MSRFFVGFLLVLVLVFFGDNWAFAGVLSERFSVFPRWEGKPLVSPARSDLFYPVWMSGCWNVTSILLEMVAPLAPDVVTPGFEGNRQYVNVPISFLVRFQPASSLFKSQKSRFFDKEIVADRSFNGLNIAEAYLGKEAVLNVLVDPNSVNKQVTFLRGDRQLISTVTGRQSEFVEGRFFATEVSQQVFQNGPRIYLNEVETTTVYTPPLSPDSSIHAEQITAIYLSPQDPGYFAAGNRPVALYRYSLELIPYGF